MKRIAFLLLMLVHLGIRVNFAAEIASDVSIEQIEQIVELRVESTEHILADNSLDHIPKAQ